MSENEITTNQIASLAIIVGLLLLGVCLFLKSNQQASAKDPCHQSRVEGWEAGALSVINYDRRAESLPEFKTWAEFEAYAKESKARMASLQTFFTEMDADRALRRALRESHPKLTAVP